MRAFAKHHGLGNDFIVIDARQDDETALRDAAPALCDRHRGVGADGLLLLLRTTPRPFMRVINADGSVPEMCGNGLRCFVQWLDMAGLLPVDGAAGSAGEPVFVDIDTDAGTLRCEVIRDEGGDVVEVEVAMGFAAWAPSQVPMDAVAPLIDGQLEVAGRVLTATALAIGNPHVVTFDDLDDTTRLRLGPRLERHPRFPARVNVEFCAVLAPASDGTAQLRVDVYERGCGWTQACGTGATAAVIAAVRTGRHQADAPMRVQLPGGWLTIRASADGEGWMRGPTAFVYRGEVDLRRLSDG
jgi:diaminopimelate epimerase